MAYLPCGSSYPSLPYADYSQNCCSLENATKIFHDVMGLTSRYVVLNTDLAGHRLTTILLSKLFYPYLIPLYFIPF